MRPPHPLRPALDALLASTDAAARLAADPLRFARRYARPEDAEVAGVFASALAFGRVGGFGPVIEAVLARADAAGGPREWVIGFDRGRVAEFACLGHRWTRGTDLALLAGTLGLALEEHGTLQALFRRHHRAGALGSTLDAAVGDLRGRADLAAGRLGLGADAPRSPGFRSLLPRPAGGSACKRWCMFLRWMVRRPAGRPATAADLDLGIWDLPPADLVIPLDTHVHRIARAIGLSARRDASWRTAVEVTRALAEVCPEDPCRYDFALAHLGIAGVCVKGEPRCGVCALAGVCLAGEVSDIGI